MFITHKNITESLVRSLQSSFSSQSNCEISLLCDGKYLKCHRHVLALHSKHFSNLFKDQINYPTTVCVVNMKYNHLKAMLDYMYYGRIKLHEDSEEMQQLVKCAEDLGLTALVGFITDFLKNSKQKVNHLNAVNGDDSFKRKRDDDSSTTQPGNESFKKPKSSTPLREPSKLSGKNATSDVKKSKSEPLVNNDEADDEETKQRVEEEEHKKKIQREEELKIAAEKKKKEEEAAAAAAAAKRIEEEEERKKEKQREETKQRVEEERKKKIQREEELKIVAEKKKKEEEEAAAAEDRIKKVTTKCDESASTKSCAVCNKQYKDSIDHRKVLEGITFQKKCIITGCNKSLPFRRALIDHLLKAHKIDVCDA